MELYLGSNNTLSFMFIQIIRRVLSSSKQYSELYFHSNNTLNFYLHVILRSRCCVGLWEHQGSNNVVKHIKSGSVL
jgi:hypothetical protein